MPDFHDDDIPTPPTCPMCDSPCEPLGTLGALNHFRCRGCGMNHSTPTETDDA